jgi:hypothetical protein
MHSRRMYGAAQTEPNMAIYTVRAPLKVLLGLQDMTPQRGREDHGLYYEA